MRGVKRTRFLRLLARSANYLAGAGIVMVFAVASVAESQGADKADNSGPKSSNDGASPVTSAAVSISRADLAAAYLRLEQAYFSQTLEANEITRINQAFDQATKAFFLGNSAKAIREIDALTESLAAQKPSPAEQALLSFKVTVDPPVWQAGRPMEATCRVTSMYEYATSEPLEIHLKLRLVNADGNTIAQQATQVTLEAGQPVDVRAPLAVAADRLAPGQYRIELSSDTDRSITAVRVNVVAGATLDQQREANERRLETVKATTPHLRDALASCRARNQLLSDHPSEKNSAQFLADLNALALDVSREIEALESGQAPYLRRSGDYWRVLAVGQREVPLRMYVPDAAAGDTPSPLLVVLHGMGGDENMFLEAYGAGAIKQVADRNGLLIASPLTYTFGSDIKTVQALVDALSRDYAIDRDRVYVLGHSMGAGAASALARGHADTIAAACCIAGGSFQARPGTPPILIVSPELDGVVPPDQLQKSARRAISEGMPGELKIMPGYGHTLAVGAILSEAVDWLLQYRRPATD